MEELPLIFLEKPQRIDTGGGSQLAAIFISIFCMFFLGCRRDLDAAISILDCDAGGKEVVENLSCVDIVLLLRLKLLNPGLQFRLLLLGTVDRGLPHGCFLPVSFCLSFCPSAFQTYLEHICSDTFMGCKTMKIWVRQWNKMMKLVENYEWWRCLTYWKQLSSCWMQLQVQDRALYLAAAPL